MPRSALDVSQISWRTCVAHLPTEDIGSHRIAGSGGSVRLRLMHYMGRRACSRFDWWMGSQSGPRRASTGSSPRRSASM